MASPKYIILGISLFLIYLISITLININPLNEHINGNYKVVDHIGMGSVIKVRDQHVLIHSKIKVSIGDEITIDGWVQPVKNYHNFDAITYLKTKKISSEIFPQNISIVSYNRNFFNLTRSYIENGDATWRKIAPMLLLGERSEETKSIFEISKRLSILHLFVISGFHIGITHKIVYTIFKKIKIPYFDSNLAVQRSCVNVQKLNSSVSAFYIFLFFLFIVLWKCY